MLFGSVPRRAAVVLTSKAVCIAAKVVPTTYSLPFVAVCLTFAIFITFYTCIHGVAFSLSDSVYPLYVDLFYH